MSCIAISSKRQVPQGSRRDLAALLAQREVASDAVSNLGFPTSLGAHTTDSSVYAAVRRAMGSSFFTR